MRVLLLAPNYSATAPGESWSTFKWVEGISRECDATVLTQHSANWDPESSPVSARKIVNWNEPQLPGMRGRLAWELKPGYIWFYFRARRWIREAADRGEKFDLIHQINPLALRYPTPTRHVKVPYLIGPLAGSLPTPLALKDTTPERQWYRKLRAFDSFRLRRDPFLRRSYQRAAAVVGVAPYVLEFMTDCGCPPRRFEMISETGVDQIAPASKVAPSAGEPLRLLFVGRLIRTKGVLEAIEAAAAAAKKIKLTFDIVGAGDVEQECRSLVGSLGVGDIVRFHGRQSREEVFSWYDRSHIFLFPSYREPSGNVVFEAMGQGLPVITSNVGGPAHVVDDASGYRAAVESRSSFVAQLEAAIVRFAQSPAMYEKTSASALARIGEIAFWPTKIRRMLELYRDIVTRPKDPSCP